MLRMTQYMYTYQLSDNKSQVNSMAMCSSYQVYDSIAYIPATCVCCTYYIIVIITDKSYANCELISTSRVYKKSHSLFNQCKIIRFVLNQEGRLNYS